MTIRVYAIAFVASCLLPLLSISDAAELIVHLPLDGNAGAGAAGTGGTENGTVGYVGGKFGQAAQTAAYGDGSIVLNDDVFSTLGSDTDFSISMWVNADAYASSDPAFASNKNWDSGSNTGINFAVKSGGTLDINTKAETGDRSDIDDGELGTITAGQWDNLILTVDRDGSFSAFINGLVQPTVEVSSIGSFDGASNFTLLNDGTGVYGAGAGSVTNLRIDDFAVFTGILSAGEISTLQTNSAATVPEPAAAIILALGLLSAGLIRRR